MHPFKFRLQTKLKVTSIYEDMAREQLRIQLSTRDIIAEQVRSLDQQANNIEQSIRLMKSDEQEYRRMVFSREYLPVLKEKKISKTLELAQAESKVDKARDLVQARSRESNTLEKLKEREWADYLYENSKEEQKTIDEAAIVAFYRNRSQTAVG
jgi:flagellar FliJ protein